MHKSCPTFFGSCLSHHLFRSIFLLFFSFFPFFRYFFLAVFFTYILHTVGVRSANNPCPFPVRSYENETKKAYVPLGPSSLKMGTPDGGRTVLNSSPALDKATKIAAEKLGLRAHTVGGKLALQSHLDRGTQEMKQRRVNVGGQVLHAAADVEGHEGGDSR